ncbi:MAG: MaoC family dehydratase N-terminal domain-containing protein [Rhizobiales bacterium]|nr:MaoC family dehydratase N-terminal domain-containing protein [Hyphomicrobiales bacterium]
MIAPVDINHLKGWIGRSTEAEETLSRSLVERFCKTLDADPARLGETPAGLHWCLAPPAVSRAEIGPDGHPAKGGFLPPVPLAYRMWAAGDLRFQAPLPMGEPIRRRSEIIEVNLKQGSAGALVFVEVGHVYHAADRLLLEERQTIVYKAERAVGDATIITPGACLCERRVETDPVLLFRYSALTFNGHRIHYDYPYARDVELYPDLVVHGPMLATFLMHLAEEGGRKMAGEKRALSRFRFRGVSPAFCNHPIRLIAAENDTGLALQALGEDDRLVMKAEAEFSGDSE